MNAFVALVFSVITHALSLFLNAISDAFGRAEKRFFLLKSPSRLQ
jgi:hypothetical protein